jgi:uncharacterized protein (DUF39 family)
VPKTLEEINAKIGQKKAVVVTAEQMSDIVSDRGAQKAAQEVDVVTTGTFGPMCSSGALLNTGHPQPKMNYKSATLNGVEAYCGIAAVDLYLGATQVHVDDPANKAFPGRFPYGGGHVIEDLIAGKEVVFKAQSYGTHCYPRRELESLLSIDDLNTASLLNPRNAYQNYNVATNAHSKKPIYTYLGILKPNMANATYCSAGGLSPLLCDPNYRTIGIGTRIFIGGAIGYVFNPGTQHDPSGARNSHGVPQGGAATLAVIGDMKKMSTEFVRGVSLSGYGPSLAVGIGIPIPILDEDLARSTGITDDQIHAPVWDYSDDYPGRKGEPLALVTYAQLRTGQIQVQGKTVQTAGMSSLLKARQIASTLKKWIDQGTFQISAPVELLPGKEDGVKFSGFHVRPLENAKTRRAKR